MKKVISGLLSFILTASLAGAFAVTASAESELKFNGTFTEAADISEFTLVGEGDISATPNITHNPGAGTMEFTGWGSAAALMLPERVNEKNFVMEAEYQYSLTEEYANGAIWLGFIFNYEDASNYSAIRYKVTDGTVAMINVYEGVSNTRYAEKGRGAGSVTGENETVKHKLIVNEGMLEFFVNGELCYTYYSPDDSRATTTAKVSTAANNFTNGGRLGLYVMGDKAKFAVNGVRVRTVDAADKAFHTDAYIDPNMSLGFANMNSLDSYFYETDKYTKGNWGEATWQAEAYNTIGQYSTVAVSGDYTVDLDFAYNRPFDSSRYMSIVFGIKDNEDGTLSFNTAGVRIDGSQFIEQHTITDGVDARIETAKYSYGDCRKVLPADKQNPDYDGETNNYFINYHPEGEEAPTAAAELALYRIARRNTMRLSVVDGVASLSFGGSTITCEIDTNSTDGYVGIVSSGVAAKIYSFRSAPYYVDEPIADIKTTMEFDYLDIQTDFADADVVIDDKLNLIGKTTKLIVAAYQGETLLGVSIENAADGLNMASVEYAETDSTDGITLRAYLWDISAQKPVINAVSSEQ